MNTQKMLVCVAFFITGQAHGRIVEVRSGEHENFSRIVMNVPRDTEWNIEQAEGQVLLEVKIPDIEFDTASVFNRIPHSRLNSLTQDSPGAALRMDIGCDCLANVFVHSGTLLVVDIRDSLRKIELQSGEVLEEIKFRYVGSSPQQYFVPMFSLALTSKQVSEPAVFQEDISVKPLIHSESYTEETEIASELTKLSLMEGIEEAASLGFLQLFDRAHLNDNDVYTSSPYSEAQGFLNIGWSGSTNQLEVVPLSVSERSWNERHAETPRCLSAHLVALPEWGDGSEFFDQIEERRSRLYDEYGELDRFEVILFAKTFLHFGFGVEASQVLELIPENFLQKQVLEGISEIFNSRIPGAGNLFAGMEACDGDVALWAYLVDFSLSKPGDVSTNSVLTAFSRLPFHLREYLGSKLAKKFSDAGDFQSAKFVLQSASKNSTRLGSNKASTIFSVEEENSGDERDRTQLNATSWVEAEKSPEFLIDFVDSMASAGPATFVPKNLPNVIASFLVEYRNTNIGPSLARAYFLSLALSGRFAEAFDSRSAFFENLDDDPEDLLVHRLLRLLTEQAGDLEFLQIIFSQLLNDRDKTPADLENSIASRLLSLGFPERAQMVLKNGVFDLSEKRSRAVLGAKISIARGLPHRALADLSELKGLEENRVRSAAFFRAGDYHQAGMTIDEFGDEFERVIWHADGRGFVSENGDSPYFFATLAAKNLDLLIPRNELPESLKDISSLLESAKGIRSNVDELLGAIEPISANFQ